MTEEKQVDATYKIVIVGDASTGKTSWLTRLTRQTFHAAIESTSGIYCSSHAMMMLDNCVNYRMWDLGGGLEYRVMTRSACQDASGVLLIYDLTNRTSFKNCDGWLKEIRHSSASKFQIMLIGNKTDLDESRAVSTQEAQTFATENGLLFMESSALNGDHVQTAFRQMATVLFYRNREELPFQVALVDRKSAAKGQLHCVEKPLQDDLKFVALSYRWGELHESMVDTGIGYTATITSFRLDDFYGLCQTMEYDPHLKEMDYVWVDAICVDQVNYERRKMTIYHMSEIYKHATYILAVPDLHLQHIKDASITTRNVIANNLGHVGYLYNVFHGKFPRLHELDNAFLDTIDFPRNEYIRLWLIKYSDHLTTGLVDYVEHAAMYDPVSALEHLCETIVDICQSSRSIVRDRDISIDFTTHYCSRTECPLDLYDHFHGAPWKKIRQSKKKNVSGQGNLMAYIWSKKIIDRSNQIRQGIEHCTGLIKDWSTRAWVISEFNIAKKKNNLKYWFIQLSSNEILSEFNIATTKNNLYYASIPNYRFPRLCVHFFYRFDFDNYIVYPRCISSIKGGVRNNPFDQGKERRSYGQYSAPACQEFHDLLIRQLQAQSFLGMILKSKASRNEDRFYAVLPSSDYSHILENRGVVSSWNIQSMVSVKLKMYEWMTTEDKLNLFFISGHWGSVDSHPVSPTFATSTIYWEDDRVEYPPIFDYDDDKNFDMSDTGNIRLVAPIDNNNNTAKCYLRVNPIGYYKLTHTAKSDYLATAFPDYKTVCERLQIDTDSNTIDVVFIPPRLLKFRNNNMDYWFYNSVFLIGSMAANKWVIHRFLIGEPSGHDNFKEWQHYKRRKRAIGFNVY